MIIGHKKQWEFLKKNFELNQLSHAYLFTGAKEIGKKFFAKEFSEFIGCRFPDLMMVDPEDGKPFGAAQGGGISIKKIREVQNFLAYKSYNGEFKIVIIDDAEKMNQEAQSCFLKTLEEPKGKTLLILISSKPDMLLSTIISRCQALKFFRPKELPANPERLKKNQEILKELMPVISSGFADKFKYAKSIDFEKQNAGDIVEVMQRYLRHLLLLKIGIEKLESQDASFEKYSVNDIKKVLNLAENINNKLLFTNANPKLALEILLLEI